jgi:hypothetical protein
MIGALNTARELALGKYQHLVSQHIIEHKEQREGGCGLIIQRVDEKLYVLVNTYPECSHLLTAPCRDSDPVLSKQRVLHLCPASIFSIMSHLGYSTLCPNWHP